MPIRRPSRVTPNFDQMEPRLTPSGITGISPASLAAARSSFPGDMHEIMRLFHQLAASQRATAREARDLAREAQLDAFNRQVVKLREAANLSLASGIVTGTTSIAGGMANLQQSARLIKTHHLERTPPIVFDRALADLDRQLTKTTRHVSNADEASSTKMQQNMDAIIQQVRDHMTQLAASQAATMQAIVRG